MTREADLRSWEPLLPRAPIDFPEDFMWGVASSAYQSEGGDFANDWSQQIRAGRFPANPGNGFWDRAEEDFRLVASLGLRHYRLSVEWSRVAPEPGGFDARAIERYRVICSEACEAGLTPWVNLFHFTHPAWLEERGGLRGDRGRDDFRRYVERMARALDGTALHYHSQNESMIYVFGAYLIGELPPFVADGTLAMQMTERVLRLHADAYQIIKEVEPDNHVATIECFLDFHPWDPESDRDREAADSLDRWYHGAVLDGLATGAITLPDGERREIPGLRGALDSFGVNYYAATRIGARGRGSYSDLADPPLDAMGRAVHPRGLETALHRVAAALPGTKILVTENGCPSLDEDFRIRYVAAHLAALDRARQAGVPVGGYFHWTAVDNYEWAHGFGDARFGLIGFDPVTLARRPKRSAAWLAEVISGRRLEPDTLA